MSTNLGNLYTVEQASNARINATSIISDTGTNLSNIPPSVQIGAMKSLDTSGGLKANEVYIRSADGLSILNVRRKHKHNENSDEAGGLLLDSFIYNPRIIVFGFKPSNTIADYRATKSGAADVYEVVDTTNGVYHQLHSTWSGTVGEYVNAQVQGSNVNLGFSNYAFAIITLAFNYANAQVVRVGFGMEETQNTIDTTRKLGMEMCPSTGTNFQQITANGIQRTTAGTTMPTSPDTLFRSFRMFFDPILAQFTILSSDGAKVQTNLSVPSGGFITPNRIFRAGINTLDPTPKDMWISRLRLVGNDLSSLNYDNPDV